MITRPRHKFKAVPTSIDGIRFASKKEASYFAFLTNQKNAGKVLFFLRQVPFHLPGGVKYVADFQVFYSDGSVQFIDVKGYQTSEFKMKKKMVEDLYPVEIVIVTDVLRF